MNTQAQGRMSILHGEAFAQSRLNDSIAIRVLMADPDVSLALVYRELVLAAVLGAFEAAASPPERVELDIEVCGDFQLTDPAMCFNSIGEKAAHPWKGSGEADR